MLVVIITTCLPRIAQQSEKKKPPWCGFYKSSFKSRQGTRSNLFLQAKQVAQAQNQATSTQKEPGPRVSKVQWCRVRDFILGSYLSYPGNSEEANALSPSTPGLGGCGVCAQQVRPSLFRGHPLSAAWDSGACCRETGSSRLQGGPGWE